MTHLCINFTVGGKKGLNKNTRFQITSSRIVLLVVFQNIIIT